MTIDLEDDFAPTCMAHPDTYLNKVVVGSQQGSMQLWNFVKGTRLYKFSVADCAIKCIAPSPALDVIGIGMADGYSSPLGCRKAYHTSQTQPEEFACKEIL